MSVLDGTSDLENTSASFQYLVCFSVHRLYSLCHTCHQQPEHRYMNTSPSRHLVPGSRLPNTPAIGNQTHNHTIPNPATTSCGRNTFKSPDMAPSIWTAKSQTSPGCIFTRQGLLALAGRQRGTIVSSAVYYRRWEIIGNCHRAMRTYAADFSARHACSAFSFVAVECGPWLWGSGFRCEISRCM